MREEQALEQLKQALVGARVMKNPDYTKTLFYFTN